MASYAKRVAGNSLIPTGPSDGSVGPMTDSGISCALVAVPGESGRGWADHARAIEQQVWSSLLVPDTLWTASPFPALAVAAGVSALRVRTWVIAAPLRSPVAVVRESSALQMLSDGRFELGIGSGRPDAERDAARLASLGAPVSSASIRLPG